MYSIINQNKSNNLDLNKEYTLIDLLPKKEEPNMKNELKNFLSLLIMNLIRFLQA